MEPLDDLPLDLLLALHEALLDSAASSRVRSLKRDANLGLHVEAAPVRFDPEPIPMEEAEEGVESLTLRFDR